MKKLLSILSIVIIASAANAVAKQHSDGAHKHKQKSSMQRLMGKNSPMPFLMPILVKQSDKLQLTAEQKQAFAKWRQEQMAPAMQLANSINETEQAIKQAAISGKSADEIEVMIQSTLDKRMELAKKMVECRDHTKQILSEAQWQTLGELYQAKMARHAH